MSCATVQFNGCNSVSIGYDKFKKSVTYKPSGELFDFTGYILNIYIRSEIGSSNTLSLTNVNDTTTSGIYLENPKSGMFVIQILSDVNNITANNYVYLVEGVSPSGETIDIIRGNIAFIEVIWCLT